MLEGGLECPHDDLMTCPNFQQRLASAPRRKCGA